MNYTTGPSEKFWLSQTAGVDALMLPLSSQEGNSLPVVITVPVPQAVAERISAVGGNSDLNILKIFLAGLSILLWKYAGQEEFLIAVPPILVPGKEHTATGILYCRLQLSEDMIVRDLLLHVHESLSQAYIHGDYDSALFKELYAADPAPLKSVGGCYGKINAAGNWLDDQQVLFEYNPSFISITSRQPFYAVSMLRNMGESLLLLMQELQLNKNMPIAACRLQTDDHVQHWQKQFELKLRAYPVHLTVTDLFLQQVKERPQTTALVYGEERISYADLDMWSRNIAAYLATRENTTGTIGIMIERSPLLVAVVLGVLRAGFAYVPLDKEYPAERIENILEDTGCSVVLTAVSALPPIHSVCEWINAYTIKESTHEVILKAPLPNSPVYILYSSGTTGRPKGIVVQHAAVTNLLYWYNERYDINADTRIIQLTNIVIDIAFQEIFSVLINGLTLYIPQEEERREKQQFIDFLQKHRISFIQLIPDMLAEYFLDVPRLPFLTHILCGGDILGENLKDAIVARGYQLYNIYGQTETAIDTVGSICTLHEPMRFNDYVPNYDVWILDQQQQLCPEYVVGEICTGGAGLSAGYVNQPMLTAEKFIAHPFKENARLYRTGDMGRRLPDGSIQFVGRKDDQVKIRGYRIQLGEIEQVLQTHTGINAAKVLLYSERAEKRLIAFISGEENLQVGALRNFLGQLLPVYMLPDQFIQVEQLPITQGGKIDSKALSLSIGRALESGVEYEAPGNETEARLVEIWQEVLGISKIGVKDNFFDLGGNSLKIVKMIGLVNKSFGKKLPVVMAFKLANIAALSAYIASGDETDLMLQESNPVGNIGVLDETLRILKQGNDE
ncbi:hypothetical protein BW716_17710 [[Flexibacter] sp. ATCC 35208]|nr:hypothetical protein BW716_17710 [[Flexibacter] sp. ATCC 35208]